MCMHFLGGMKHAPSTCTHACTYASTPAHTRARARTCTAPRASPAARGPSPPLPRQTRAARGAAARPSPPSSLRCVACGAAGCACCARACVCVCMHARAHAPRGRAAGTHPCRSAARQPRTPPAAQGTGAARPPCRSAAGAAGMEWGEETSSTDGREVPPCPAARPGRARAARARPGARVQPPAAPMCAPPLQHSRPELQAAVRVVLLRPAAARVWGARQSNRAGKRRHEAAQGGAYIARGSCRRGEARGETERPGGAKHFAKRCCCCMCVCVGLCTDGCAFVVGVRACVRACACAYSRAGSRAPFTALRPGTLQQHGKELH